MNGNYGGRTIVATNISKSKAGYFILEGTNSFASSYFFGGLMFLLHREFGFGDLAKLTVGAVHGLVYALFSWLAGKFGQRYGCFASLRIGFGGMFLSIGAAWILGGIWGHLAAFGVWTVCICFTWANLEALVSEDEPRSQLPCRVGQYNVVWAGTAAVGYFLCRWVFDRLGPASLYWLPMAFHAVQWVLLAALARRHADSPFPHAAGIDDGVGVETGNGVDEGTTRQFRKLGWLASPFAYMAINTLMVVSPSVADRVGLDPVSAPMWLSVWLFARAASFGILWAWPGWHYRFGWFLGAFAVLLGSFVWVMVTQSRWGLVLGQAGFGLATGLLYYSALYYAMDASETQAEHGGMHEAFIGAGIGGGPAVSAMSLWLAPRLTAGPAWAVSAFLVVGLIGVWWSRPRASEKRAH